MNIEGIQIDVVDMIALGVILFFFVLGIFKGFTFQVVRIATFLAALAVAKSYAGSSAPEDHSGLSHQLMTWFPNQLDNKSVAVYIAFFLIFIGIFIAGTLIAFLLRALLKRLELRAYDKLLGGALGVVVGVMSIVVVISCLVFVSPESSLLERMGQSHTMRLSAEVIKISTPFFPEALREEMTEIARRIEPLGGGEPGGSPEIPALKAPDQE
jgi:uncharacterized membrane protein required for colicin V production